SPDEALYLKVMGRVGHIVPVPANVTDEASVARAVAGSDWVVNLVGILAESGGNRSFERVHAQGAANIAKAAAASGVVRLVHVSALGASDQSPAKYGKSKAKGEAAVRSAFPAAVILRPSVVFGPEDNLFNMFACMAKFSPVLPVIDTSFQPVYVGDVADAIMAGLTRDDAVGGTYELGGPEIANGRRMMELVLRHTARKRCLVSVPFWILAIEGLVLQYLPGKLLTADQVLMLHAPNVVSAGAKTLADLGIQATPMDAILSTYLNRYRLPVRPGLAR
ncbi:MAG: dehydrogenase (ubiquinone), partial [Rhodospirillales bacterium]|nr:dehydrogenase (ubiquinone) [Rhodospirillales bacterium]